MSDLVSFSVQFMTALADFLAAPPIFNLFALILFLFVCKAIKIIIR